MRTDKSHEVGSGTGLDGASGEPGVERPEGQIDASRKSYRAILAEEIEKGLAEAERPSLGLLLSSFAAGLEISFSVVLMATALTLFQGQASPPATELLVAQMYSFGFILVILGRSELFTEHTAMAVLPVMARRVTLTSLTRVWAVVYIGNLLGCLLFSGLLIWIVPAREVIDVAVFEKIAHNVLGDSWWITLLNAILAGWLMGLLGWIVAAARDTISQIVSVWLIASAIGFAKLHHCIVGTVEALPGVFTSESLTASDFGHFLLWTTLGNAIGGVVFVAGVKYGHASRGTPRETRTTTNPEGSPE